MWPAPPRTPVARTNAAVLAAVMVAAVLVPLLLARRGCGCAPPGPEPAMGLDVRQQGTDWTVLVVSVPGGLLPASTYLEVWTQGGRVALRSAPFGAMTPANWTVLHALYRDANPKDSGIAAGDALLLDGGTYRSGGTFEIRDDAHVLARGILG